MPDQPSGSLPITLDLAEDGGFEIDSLASRQPGGGWGVTVTIVRTPRREPLARFDLGAYVVFAEPKIAEAAGLAFARRWIEKRTLP